MGIDLLRSPAHGLDVISFAKPPRPRRRKTANKPTNQVGCCCANCRRQRPCVKWPRYYMGIPAQADHTGEKMDLLMSYECHLERQTVDEELAEILQELRNEPQRDGSVWIGGMHRKKHK